jgi:hypothetical protein
MFIQKIKINLIKINAIIANSFKKVKTLIKSMLINY